MHVSIFNFGMKYRKSQNKLICFVAEICIAEGKREADRVEKGLRRKHLKKLNRKCADKIRDNILKE